LVVSGEPVRDGNLPLRFPQSTEGVPHVRVSIAMLVLFLATAAQAEVWRVDARSTAPAPDGYSWQTAFPTIDAAVEAAGDAGGGEIWVAGGVYGGARQGLYLRRETGALVLPPHVALYGGFSGAEESLAARDWHRNVTIIDGSAARGGAPAHHVVIGATGALLDGFVVSGGNAAGGLTSEGLGGGLLNHHANMTVRHCTFVGNNGGGVYNFNADATIDQCRFEATDGPAVFNRGGAPQVLRSYFDNPASTPPSIHNFYSEPVLSMLSFSTTRDEPVFNIASNPQMETLKFRDTGEVRHARRPAGRGETGTPMMHAGFAGAAARPGVSGAASPDKGSSFAINSVEPGFTTVEGGQRITLRGNFPVQLAIASVATAEAAYGVYFQMDYGALEWARFDPSANPVATPTEMHVLAPPYEETFLGGPFGPFSDYGEVYIDAFGFGTISAAVADASRVYYARSWIEEVEPDYTLIGGGERITLRGTFPVAAAISSIAAAEAAYGVYFQMDFGAVEWARFDPSADPIITPTEMHVLAPPYPEPFLELSGDEGIVYVEVFEDGSTITGGALDEPVVAYRPGWIESVTPDRGPRTGEQPVTLAGSFPVAITGLNAVQADAAYLPVIEYQGDFTLDVGRFDPSFDPAFTPTEAHLILPPYQVGKSEQVIAAILNQPVTWVIAPPPPYEPNYRFQDGELFSITPSTGTVDGGEALRLSGAFSGLALNSIAAASQAYAVYVDGLYFDFDTNASPIVDFNFINVIAPPRPSADPAIGNVEVLVDSGSGDFSSYTTIIPDPGTPVTYEWKQVSTVSASAAAAGCGGEAEVSISINPGAGIADFEITIAYDNASFEFVGYSAGAATADWEVLDATRAAENEITLAGRAIAGTPILDLGQENIVADLIFECIACPSAAPITIVDASTDNGGFGILNFSEGSITCDPAAIQASLSVATAPVASGGEVDIDINVDSGAAPIGSYQVELLFDPSALVYESGLAGDAGTFDAPFASVVSPGVLRCIRAGDKNPSGTFRAATLRFRVVADVGASPAISFSQNSTFRSPASAPLTYFAQGTVVNITEQGEGEGGEGEGEGVPFAFLSRIFVSSAQGDDAFGDGTKGKPWATIGRALAYAEQYVSADFPVTIYAEPGLYPESVQMTSHTTLRGVKPGDPGLVVIAPPFESLLATRVAIEAAAGVTVSDFTVQLEPSSPELTTLLKVDNVVARASNLVLDGGFAPGAIGAQFLSAGSSGSELRESRITGVAAGIRVIESEVNLTRNTLDTIEGNAITVVPPTGGGGQAAPLLGDEFRAEDSGVNFLDAATIDGFLVRNLSQLTVLAQNIDWGVYDTAAIASNTGGPVVFLPFLGSALQPSATVVVQVAAPDQTPVLEATVRLVGGGTAFAEPTGLPGQYLFPLIPPAQYSFLIEAPGFLPLQIIRSIDSNFAEIFAILLPQDPGAFKQSFDTDADGRIDLSEVLAMIQLYNASKFHCAGTAAEFPYEIGPGTLDCEQHTLDYRNPAWVIDISELLRAIQFYNVDGYTYCPGEDTEDLYCPVSMHP